MQSLSQYITENVSTQRIDEFLGLGNIIKIFKRIFMPWTDEAINYYKKLGNKIFMESGESGRVLESATVLQNCKQKFTQKYSSVTVELYDMHSEKKFALDLLNKILSFKEHPNVAQFEEEASRKNTGYGINIYLEDPQKGLFGIFAPGQDGKLTCLMNFIQESDDAQKVTGAIKSSLEKIFADCIARMK